MNCIITKLETIKYIRTEKHVAMFYTQCKHHNNEIHKNKFQNKVICKN